MMLSEKAMYLLEEHIPELASVALASLLGGSCIQQHCAYQ